MSVGKYKWCDVPLSVWWSVQMYIRTDRQVDKGYAGAAPATEDAGPTRRSWQCWGGESERAFCSMLV